MTHRDAFDLLEELRQEFDELKEKFLGKWPLYLSTQTDLERMRGEFDLEKQRYDKRWTARDKRFQDCWIIRLMFGEFWRELLEKTQVVPESQQKK